MDDRSRSDSATAVRRFKPSVVKWLGALPTHWRTVRAKRLFRKMDRPVRQDDEVVTCFRDGTVTLRRNRRELGFTESLKEIGYQGVRRGDLVIHAMDAFAGACGVADSDGKSTPVYAVCAPKDESANSRYYAFCVREMARSQWILALSRGVRERSTDFRFATFGNQWVPVPPSQEQTAIVRFLDHADRRIRRYIRAKERLIELLEEEKQAIIHQAITGQIDVRTSRAYPAYRDSGLPWLRDVPVHWRIERGKWLFRCINVRSTTGTEELLTVSSDRGVVPRSSVDVTMFKALSYIGHKLCWPGDLVINSLWAWSRGLGVSPLHGIISTAYGVYRLRNPARISSEYIHELVRSPAFKWELRVRSKGIWISRLQLTDGAFFTAPFPVPPLREQQAIVDAVRETSTETDVRIERSQRQIALLEEYRTRLIADVVTGKLDVREAAAALPDIDPLAAEDTLVESGEPIAGPEPAIVQSHP